MADGWSRSLAPHLSRLVACPIVADVLLATDADWIFEDVDAALTDDGTSVVRVRSGRDVGPAVREIDPVLVVLDLQIGNMGGIATALDLQQRFDSGEVPQVPILLLLDRPADVPMARRTGVQGWLLKPLDAFRLRRAGRAVAAGDTYFQPSGLIPA
jgi:DNA-binding NarL/FixJ family response regulator